MSSSSRSSTPKLSTSKQQHQQQATPLGGVRSNASSPAPTPASAPAPAPAPASSRSTGQPLPDLSNLLNLPVEVTTVGASPRTIKATLYTYDAPSSIVVLSTPPPPSPSSTSTTTTTALSSSAGGAFRTRRQYHLLKTSQIASVRVSSPAVPDPSFPRVDEPLPVAFSTPATATAATIQQRVQQAVVQHEKERSRVGPAGLTQPDAQLVYDLMAKTLPVRWTDRGEIVVMDEVVVDPNQDWSVKGARGSQDRIDRVRKVLEGIRARVAANGGSATPKLG
ncbi:hypothetical protein JCM3766R1_004853 [Sporobolomyces carnicolor]